MSENITNTPADDTSDEDRNIAYKGLTDAQRGMLAASIDMSDPASAMARLTVLNSDEEVSDEDARALGWVQTYTLGLTTQKRDKTVTRRKRRGRIGNLDSFVAGLDGGACGIDPDTVVYVRDDKGDEVLTTVGQGDDKRRVPLAEVRGTVTGPSGLSVRLTDGTVHACESGKRVTPADVGGEEAYGRIAQFSRDGGATWADVVWRLTLPNKRTAGAPVADEDNSGE